MSSDELTLNETEKKKIINEIAISNVESVEFVNIGAGADCMVVLVGIRLVYEIIKAGKYINDGIDGWIKIGNRLKNLVKRNKIISIDSEGATLLAIELISQKENIKLLKLCKRTQ